jgi:hypothetical protein
MDLWLRRYTENVQYGFRQTRKARAEKQKVGIQHLILSRDIHGIRERNGDEHGPYDDLGYLKALR